MRPLSAAWVIGAGHSGSTLLGMMLGAHSRAFYAGEAKKSLFLGDETKPKRKRECKLCGASCKVWGGLRDVSSEALYATLRQRTGAGLIVDSTKNLEWVRGRAEEEPGALLFLTRDGRAVVNSRLRKYPERSVASQVEDWVAQVEASAAYFAKYAGPKQKVAYEELASHPERVLRNIATTLGIEYEEAMLRFEQSEQHPLGGNNGTQSLLKSHGGPAVSSRHGRYYADHPGGVVLDLRWKREMPSAALETFEALAGAVGAAYAYEGEE